MTGRLARLGLAFGGLAFSLSVGSFGIGLVAVESTAWAQNAPEEAGEALGEVHIKMDHEFAKVRVNGEEWEDSEFTADGKTVMIRKLPRKTETKITLRSAEDGHLPIELVVAEKDFKEERRKQGKARVVYYVAKFSVKFVAGKEEAPPAPSGGTTKPEEE